jgi:hypothetical protein
MALRPIPRRNPHPGVTITFHRTAPARPSPAASLAAVHDAVRRAAGRLAMLPGPPVTGWEEVGAILDEFVRTVSPIERTMPLLWEADPSGELAILVDYLATAAGYLAEGDVDAARATIVGGDLYLASGG